MFRMKNLKQKVFSIVLSILLGLIATTQVMCVSSLAEKAQMIADAIVSDYGVTSVQYAIIDHDDFVLSGGSGVFDKEKNRAITKDDLFGIGSTSKMFVTAAVMMLWDQGQLDLDKPLTTYIPEFTMMDERYMEITPRMLLNHSSGLFGSSFSNTFLLNDVDPLMHDTLLSQLTNQRLKAAPGQFSEYCNDGFTLLEILVERISGTQYANYLAEHFMKPLGLQNTKTPQDTFDKDKRLVKVYIPQFAYPLPADTVNALGTGGLYSTAEDLCKFSRVLMGKRPELLSEQATLLMQNEEYKNGMWVEAEDGNFIGNYGLGWDTVHSFPFGDYGLQVFTKGGDTQLFHSSLVVIPALDIAMAVVSSGGASIIDYAFAADILQEYLLEKGIIHQISPPRTITKPVQVEMPQELEACSGYYVNASTWARLEVKDGVLTVFQPGDIPEERWVYAGKQGFLSEDGSISLAFTRQADGELYLQKSQIFSFAKVGQAAMTELVYQRAAPNIPEKPVLEAWKPRAGKKYYVISEKPSSQIYMMGPDALRMKLNEDFSNGFTYGGTKILDENHAINIVKFRDVSDLGFFVKNDIEYLDANSIILIREDFIPRLPASIASSVIGEDGFAQYYSIGFDTEGKTIVINLPHDAAFAVYDKDDNCINFTTVSKNNSTLLPADGKIVLIGKAGDAFDIELQ